MQDLWGNTAASPQPSRKAEQQPQAPRRRTATLECAYYGHTWQRIGLSGEKRCTVCGIKGYCPGCTPHPPAGAHPFYCTKHTPPESAVQA
jgi:hypothetical protein